MRVLRLRHSLTAGGGSLVSVDYDPGQGASGFTSQVPLLFDLAERDRDRLRFYLENFLTCPNPAALKPVGELQIRLRRWGEELFRQVFGTDRKAQWHFEEAARDLQTLRLEVLSEHPDAWTIPWELLCDPNRGWLVPQMRSFVRRLALPFPPDEEELPVVPSGPLRVLYVVGRPPGSMEIPFHSVALPLLRGAAEPEGRVRIDFLRPPTFERLARVMGEAVEAGNPYHVLHFDGHGVYTDSPQDFAGEVDPRFVQQGERLERRPWTRRRGGARGYLFFEDLEGSDLRRLVDGVQIGHLAARTRVPLVVLHACQSATARVETLERLAADPTAPGRCPAAGVGEAPDEHDQDLAYQSLASEIMRANPRSVVALPWTLPPSTATRVLAGIYGRLAAGEPVGEAVGAMRRELLHGIRRESVLGSVEMDDWLVPVVYETRPWPICAADRSRRRGRTRPAPREEEPAASAGGAQAAGLPPPPAWGFVDRPEVLFTLDRAFDVHRAVLLHALAGAGKTAMARELALWYRDSGGLREDGGEPGEILWTDFADGPAALFDSFEAAFRERLAGTAWSRAGREERGALVLEVLRRVPAFWVWDHVELAAGVPPGSAPRWSEEERGFLTGLLSGLAETRCRVLLAGRRAEEAWLGDLPCRVALPPMPMEERGGMTVRIAARHGLAVQNLAAFGPILWLSQGNPLTLSFLLGESMGEGRRRPEEVEMFLAGLRLDPDREPSRPESPAAALLASLRRGYGGFREEERRLLGLLHLFRGCVDLEVLSGMGHPEAPWCLPQLPGVVREVWIELLDRAAGAGFLSRGRGGCYGLHPALPFLLRVSFERFWRGSEEPAARAYAESLAGLSAYGHRELLAGRRGVLADFLDQEANLQHARALALRNAWWGAAVSITQGLEALYTRTGRQDEADRLLRETVPVFVDPQTEEPLPGREPFREVMVAYSSRLAWEEEWED